jgi:hypothetical protein
MASDQSAERDNVEGRCGHYLKRAAQAEAFSEKSPVAEIKQAYHNLADSWRSLAQAVEKPSARSGH